MTEENKGFTIYGLPVRGRSCGSCKLCCTLLPVDLPEGKKPANVKCRHLCSKGCSIYENRPTPCEYWSCRWLFDEATADLHRPDKCGYVIDSMLDTILADGEPVEVVQVWVDPARRDAHRDPRLRAYLMWIAETYRMPAIIRWSSSEGIVLIAPPLSKENEWLEIDSGMKSHEEMTQLLGNKAQPWRR
jgi:hypothetical protein